VATVFNFFNFQKFVRVLEERNYGFRSIFISRLCSPLFPILRSIVQRMSFIYLPIKTLISHF